MAEDTPQADGYYGEEPLDNEEIDLSFLDDKDSNAPSDNSKQ